MEYNELYHHGVQGMKWGVRRFQNKDGSLTAAGKKRVAEREKMSPEKKKEIAKKVATAAVALGTVAAATAYAKKHPEKIASVINKVKDVNVEELSKSSIEKGKAFVTKSRKVNTNEVLKNMSDDELKKAVARMTLENNYRKMTSTTPASKQKINNAMKVASSIATATSTGLTIYNNMDRIKKIIDKETSNNKRKN